MAVPLATVPLLRDYDDVEDAAALFEAKAAVAAAFNSAVVPATAWDAARLRMRRDHSIGGSATFRLEVVPDASSGASYYVDVHGPTGRLARVCALEEDKLDYSVPPAASTLTRAPLALGATGVVFDGALPPCVRVSAAQHAGCFVPFPADAWEQDTQWQLLRAVDPHRFLLLSLCEHPYLSALSVYCLDVQKGVLLGICVIASDTPCPAGARLTTDGQALVVIYRSGVQDLVERPLWCDPDVEPATWGDKEAAEWEGEPVPLAPLVAALEAGFAAL